MYSIRKIPVDIKAQVDLNTMAIGKLSILLSSVSHANKNVNKDIELKDIIDQMDLIDINIVLYPNIAEYTFFLILRSPWNSP